MPKLSRRKFIKRGLLASIGIIFIDSFWFEMKIIRWKKFDLSAENSNKIKIIQLSDLHLKELTSTIKSLAEKVNKINPDLIFITGDAIDNGNNVELLDNFLTLINSNIQKIAILGNWEYWGKVVINELNDVYKKHKCRLLINENQQIYIKGRTLSVIGIDDYVGGKADYNKAIENLSKSEITIVLTHCPEHRDIIVRQNQLKIDFILSGHTHGGHVNILGFAPFTPRGSGRYIGGWYKDQNPILYVSKGIGTSVIPFRFGARAEVAVFTI